MTHEKGGLTTRQLLPSIYAGTERIGLVANTEGVLDLVTTAVGR